MKSTKRKIIAIAAALAFLCGSGMQAYSMCLECSNISNQPKCVNDRCDMVYQNGSMCCGNTL